MPGVRSCESLELEVAVLWIRCSGAYVLRDREARHQNHELLPAVADEEGEHSAGKVVVGLLLLCDVDHFSFQGK
jgi:hypothetical protein